MKLLLLLHFYQPHNQQDDILLRIVNECYLPLTRSLKAIPSGKILVNISGALTQLLMDKGYTEVVQNLRDLAERGQVEFLGSAHYHAFLPLLPKDEIIRQIKLNEESNAKFFGASYKPTGFFSPEMAVNSNVLSVVSELGYKWVACPQLSYPGGNPSSDKIYKDVESEIGVFFRNKRISSLILSAVCHDAQDFIHETSDLATKDKYWFAVMDAETFGHHRVGHISFLMDLINNKAFETCTASDLLNLKELPEEKVKIRPCTWSNQEQDFWLDQEHTQITEAKSYILWKDPTNPIHKLQWELVDLAINTLNKFENKSGARYLDARALLDKALASDQFWWASLKPWWSLEMVEQGAFELKKVLITLSPGSLEMTKAEKLYKDIVDIAFEWQRSGYIRKKHLENSSTYLRPTFSQRTHLEWYNQIILELENEMTLSANRRDFEKAIKWRDAIEKITNGTDVYDVLHVVDELWTARNIPSLKPFFDHSWEEFTEYAKEHFKGVLSQQDYEEWKRTKEQRHQK